MAWKPVRARFRFTPRQNSARSSVIVARGDQTSNESRTRRREEAVFGERTASRPVTSGSRAVRFSAVAATASTVETVRTVFVIVVRTDSFARGAGSSSGSAMPRVSISGCRGPTGCRSENASSPGRGLPSERASSSESAKASSISRAVRSKATSDSKSSSIGPAPSSSVSPSASSYAPSSASSKSCRSPWRPCASRRAAEFRAASEWRLRLRDTAGPSANRRCGPCSGGGARQGGRQPDPTHAQGIGSRNSRICRSTERRVFRFYKPPRSALARPCGARKERRAPRKASARDGDRAASLTLRAVVSHDRGRRRRTPATDAGYSRSFTVSRSSRSSCSVASIFAWANSSCS